MKFDQVMEVIDDFKIYDRAVVAVAPEMLW